MSRPARWRCHWRRPANGRSARPRRARQIAQERPRFWVCGRLDVPSCGRRRAGLFRQPGANHSEIFGCLHRSQIPFCCRCRPRPHKISNGQCVRSRRQSHCWWQGVLHGGCSQLRRTRPEKCRLRPAPPARPARHHFEERQVRVPALDHKVQAPRHPKIAPVRRSRPDRYRDLSVPHLPSPPHALPALRLLTR